MIKTEIKTKKNGRLPAYSGAYSVTPSSEVQTLPTANKTLTQDIVVGATEELVGYNCNYGDHRGQTVGTTQIYTAEYIKSTLEFVSYTSPLKLDKRLYDCMVIRCPMNSGESIEVSCDTGTLKVVYFTSLYGAKEELTGADITIPARPNSILQVCYIYPQQNNQFIYVEVVSE